MAYSANSFPQECEGRGCWKEHTNPVQKVEMYQEYFVFLSQTKLIKVLGEKKCGHIIAVKDIKLRQECLSNDFIGHRRDLVCSRQPISEQADSLGEEAALVAGMPFKHLFIKTWRKAVIREMCTHLVIQHFMAQVLSISSARGLFVPSISKCY